MARPSVKEERAEEILQAYERCIALYGVEGATLQKIAESAGIARPLLRHHVGNSADLLKKAVERFVQRSDASLKEMLLADCSGEEFVELLFQPTQSLEQHNDTMIAAALIYAAQTDSELKEAMNIWLEQIMESFFLQLRKSYPAASDDKLRNVSAGIIGIYFNVESLVPLGGNKALREQSYQAAMYLLNVLDQ